MTEIGVQTVVVEISTSTPLEHACVRWAKIGEGSSDKIMKVLESHLKEFVHAFVCHGENSMF